MTVDLKKLTALAARAGALSARSSQQVAGRERSWFRIENNAGANDVYLYDMIGEWGITAADFVQELGAVDGPINLHIASEGGSVFDGLAIYAALKDRTGVTVLVDSLAASAASFIAMAGDQIVIKRNAKMMVHEASGLALGTAADMTEMAALLEDMSQNIADIYAERTKSSVKHWREAMSAGAANSGTWYGADAAVSAGLADYVDKLPEPGAPAETNSAETMTTNRWDSHQFANLMKGVFA